MQPRRTEFSSRQSSIRNTRVGTQVRRPQRQSSAPQRRRRRQVPQKEGKPFLLKLFLWLGIALICFVLGYLGASLIVEFMSKKWFLKPDNIIETQEDLDNLQESEIAKRISSPSGSQNNSSGESVKQVSLVLYHVMNDSLTGTRKSFVSRTQEDNIKDAVDSILTLSGVPNSERIRLLHVFRNAETAFLDISGQFPSSLQTMGERKSLLLLTGIVRTIQENFSPISQIRFLIDSKLPASKGVVDLSVPWKMPERS